MNQRRRRITAIGVVSLLAAITLAQPVVAAVTLTTSTEYAGVEADSQAVGTTVTFSPNETEAANIEIQIDSTQNSFIDFDSLERSLNPGTSDAEINYHGNGRYTIDELGANEEVTISFDAYPKTIKSENLDVARVEVSHTQNGQNLTDSTTATGDLSNSSYFAYQDSQERINELESETEGTTLWALVGQGLVALGAVSIVLYIIWYIYF